MQVLIYFFDAKIKPLLKRSVTSSKGFYMLAYAFNDSALKAPLMGLH